MRTSPSGPFVPTASLGITAAKAFVSGTALVVPFDKINILKGDAGKLISPPDGVGSFAMGPGLYLVTATYRLSNVQGTSLKTALLVQTGSRSIVAVHQLGAANDGDSMSMTAYVPEGDTDFDVGTGVYCAVGLQITATGTSGNVNAAELTIFQLEPPG